MDDLLSAEGLQATFKFLTSLGIGLLLGLQRQRTPSAKAGLRTFGMVGVFGAMSGLIADAGAGAWVISAGLVLVGLMIVAAYRHSDGGPEADSGTTTVIAVLLCYGLGVMVWYDQGLLAVATGIVVTMLLHFKTELHGFSERLSQRDVASVLQFAVLSFIILPLLPDAGYGPYRALNPYHIWMMVVLISGIGLAGYLAFRMFDAKHSALLAGIAGGLVSSTATTLVYVQQGRANPAMASLGGSIIVISNLTVLVRLAVISMVVAPAVAGVMLPMLGSGLLLGCVPLGCRLRAAATPPGFNAPEVSNPTNLHVALGFGIIYAIILVGSAWLSDRAGSEGLYVLALASGPVDVDAITLSGLRLFNSGNIDAHVVATAVALAYGASIVFKLGVVGVAGSVRMLKLNWLALVAPGAGMAAGLVFFA